MQAVCILKGLQPDWDSAKRMLGDPGFMRSLLDFDKDNISAAVIRKLKKYVDDPQFTPEAVAKQSKAAQSLCMWARAMDVYNRVSKVQLGSVMRAFVPCDDIYNMTDCKCLQYIGHVCSTGSWHKKGLCATHLPHGVAVMSGNEHTTLLYICPVRGR